MKKKCGRCARELPLEAFHRRGNSGRQPWCKECRKVYDAAYCQRTLARRMVLRRERKGEFEVWYRALKEGSPCADCGGFYHHAAMEWDHLPGESKVADVATLAGALRRTLVLRETAKCELVCANCHGIRTFLRRTGRGAAW